MSHVDRINLKVVDAVRMFLFITIILLVPQASLGAAEGTPDFVAIINRQQIMTHDGSIGTARTAVATGHFWLNDAKTRLSACHTSVRNGLWPRGYTSGGSTWSGLLGGRILATHHAP